jgi:4-amino-4-deoxy-L-arabinose transferase-like glycosyltransferase
VSLRTLILLLLLLGVLLAIKASDNWRYLHDDTGRCYTSYARSHLTLGLQRTQGQDFFYDLRTDTLIPYGHRPPGLGLLLAGWFWVWGSDGPLVARALASGFHLLSAYLVFSLLRRYYPGQPGLIAAFGFAIVPMSSFFGKLVCYPPFHLPFIIAFLVCYWRWAEGGAPRWLALGLGVVLVATWIDWMILFAVFTAGADALRRFGRGEGGRFAWGSMVIVTVGSLSFLNLTLWLASGPAGWHALAGAATFRMSMEPNYSWWRWVGKMIDYHRRYFTEPLLLAAVAMAVFTIGKAWRRRLLAPRLRLLVLFGVAGLLPVIIFPSSARYHHYWQFYLLPYAVLSLAQILEGAGPHLTLRGRRFLHMSIVVWLVSASTVTLWYRYAHPSGYVARMLSEWQFYL